MKMNPKVAFVDFSSNFYDLHALHALSAYLKKHDIEPSYINAHSFSRMISRIKKAAPDLLLYSAYTRDIKDYIRFDRLVKQRCKVKSIIGGPGATFDWQNFGDSTIDALCLGEGEESLVEYIRNGFVPTKNIISVTDTVLPSRFTPFLDLNTVPFPDRDLIYRYNSVMRDMPNKQFLSGRGCPYMCTYCHNNIQNIMFKDCGQIVRKKSVDYLLGEMQDIRSRYPLRLVAFQDDTFIVDKKWLFEYCERFPREIGIPFTCNIRANLVDESVVKALKDGGCVGVYWSIEAGNDTIRNAVLKRGMTREQILRTSELLHKYKIPFRNGGIVGLPGETIEQMFETIDLNIITRPLFGHVSIFIPYPGLELTAYALKHKHLSEEAARHLPAHMHFYSILNFTKAEKKLIQKITYLYPFFMEYPRLFYNRSWRNFLFRLPRLFLFPIFVVYCGYKMSRVYRVELPFRLKLAILVRYFRNPF
jgi:radical SAM superfamily enzyme YgiQ (UPF0313 family)